MADAGTSPPADAGAAPPPVCPKDAGSPSPAAPSSPPDAGSSSPRTDAGAPPSPTPEAGSPPASNPAAPAAPRVPVAPGTKGKTVNTTVPIRFTPLPGDVTWSNFTPTDKSPDPPAVANTAWSLAATSNIRGDGTLSNVAVLVTMPRDKSWVIPIAKRDDVLHHERLHYRIACQGGRALQSDIKSLDSTATNADVQQLVASWRTQVQQIQDDYDYATQNGTDASAQAQWDAKVASWELSNTITYP